MTQYDALLQRALGLSHDLSYSSRSIPAGDRAEVYVCAGAETENEKDFGLSCVNLDTSRTARPHLEPDSAPSASPIGGHLAR